MYIVVAFRTKKENKRIVGMDMINKWVHYDCTVFLFSQSDPVFASSILLIEKKGGVTVKLLRNWLCKPMVHTIVTTYIFYIQSMISMTKTIKEGYEITILGSKVNR